MTRRRFLAASAAATAAFSLVPRHVLGGPGFVAPSAKVNIAIVGAGGQGRTNARNLFNEADCQIIALADPIEHFSLDGFYYRGVAGRKPVKAEIEKHYSAQTPNFRVAQYEDFRKMLEEEKAIDAILCATPDHTHAYVSAYAMRQGKHVYCEKPLTHNVWEARKLREIAKETGVATQMGNQGHSDEGIRQTVEWIRAGVIGPVREVHGWTSSGRWHPDYGPTNTEPVPAGTNWDLWLGPRSMRPYSPKYTPVTWRDYWAFGGGPFADMACHNLDAPFWALDLAAPLAVEASCGAGMTADRVPSAAIYRYTYGPRGTMPPLTLTWHDGGLRPATPPELEEGEELGRAGNGNLIIGDKGAMTCPGWGGAPRLIPLSRMENFERPPKTLPRAKGHHKDWLAACKGGPPASANFDYGAQLTEMILLGSIALRLRKKLNWDAAAMKFTNAPEAERFLKGDYRPGWEIV